MKQQITIAKLENINKKINGCFRKTNKTALW